MMLVKLKKEECYNSFLRFYETVANKAGIICNEDTFYDCRYIDVSKKCFDELVAYQIENGIGLNTETAIRSALVYGPKPSIENDDYVAEIHVGFTR